jgi:uncharacterized protein
MISLSKLDETLAVCRLPAGSPIPSWALNGSFCSVTRTPDEVSLVCPQENVPVDIQAERNWRGMKVDGALDFSLTGILAGLAGVLAEAQISLFAISTYDTDYILVKSNKFSAAIQALQAAGYEFNSE